jgi:hypothetical protein
MKLKFFLINGFFLIFFSVVSYSQPKADSIYQRYKILKIDSVDNAYIIYVEKLDYSKMMFTIVSLKNIINKKGKQIKEGKTYKMMLKPYYDTWKMASDYEFSWRVEINNEKVVFPNNKYVGQISTTLNLEGLFYKKLGSVSNQESPK